MNANLPIVVSGLGVASTLGTDVESFWSALCAGRQGYERMPDLAARGIPFHVGGRLEAIPEKWESGCTESDRATRLALYACGEALDDAGLAHDETADRGRVAVVMGTTCGTNQAIEAAGFEEAWFAGDPERCPPDSFRRYDHGSLAHAVSRRFRFEGPSYVVGTACSSGNHAIGEAINLIRAGEADQVVCGGADAFTLLPTFGFYAMKSLAYERCTPFDRDRTGLLLCEGAAALVLESLPSAEARRTRARARIDHWALNCDAANFAAPLESGERFEQLVRECLRDAGLSPSDLDYINLHGTGTKSNDAMEAQGVRRVYGAGKPAVMLGSIKGMLGHTLGAAGAFEGVAATLALQSGIVPPNTPVANLDEGVEMNIVTRAAEHPLRRILSVSFAFGGCNVATLFSRCGHDHA